MTQLEDIAAQFDSFTRQILGTGGETPTSSNGRKSLLNLERIASIW